jgi:hypothetical protein
MSIIYNKLKKYLLIWMFVFGLIGNVTAQTNVLVSDDAAVVPLTTASDGLFQINRSSGIGLDIINRTALGAGVTSELSFRSLGAWTGIIKTIGDSPSEARMGFFTSANGVRNNLAERFTINNYGNFSLNFSSAAGIIGYFNFGSTIGLGGFGLRSNAGIMEYRHNTDPIGVWTPLPPGPPGGTSVEWWLRNSGGSYIYPMMNTSIRVYDPGLTYGIYYNGSTNQYGIYSVTSSAAPYTAAVVGFSDVAGNQTYGYLGFNGTWSQEVYPGRTFTLFGDAVYGMVDDPGRAAIFSRTTSGATYAALCSYSDVWISGFFEAKDSNNFSTRPGLYSQMTTKISKFGNSDAIRGLSYYYPAAGNSGYTIGVSGYSFSNTQTGYAVYARHFLNFADAGNKIALLAGHDMTSGFDFGLYAQGSTTVYGYTGYSSAANSFGVYGRNNNATGIGIIGLGCANYATSTFGDGIIGATDNNAYGVIGSHYNGVNNGRWGALGGQTFGTYGQIDATHYGYLGQAGDGVIGVNSAGIAGTDYVTNANTGVYGQTSGGAWNFGVQGYDNSATNRSGGVLGTYDNTNWGSLGYRPSGGLPVYGGYFTSHVDGGGKSSGSEKTNVGFASTGDLFGGWVKGDLYGIAVKGDRMALYIDGKTFTNNIIAQMNDNGSTERIPTYVPTSMTVDIYMKGTGQLINGKANITFDEKYLSIISDKDPIIVTVTPMGQTNGVYIEEVKSNSFSVVENNAGKSNVAFSWIAIATKKGYENPDNPVELISSGYDTHLNEFMFNESDLNHTGKPMWWDGSQIRYDNPPEMPKSLSNNSKFIQPSVITSIQINDTPSILDTKLEKNKDLNKSIFESVNVH